MKSSGWLGKIASLTLGGRRDKVLVDELLHRGALHQQAGQSAEAEECYREALLQVPENPEVRRMLGGLLSMRGHIHQERGDVAAAIELYEEALMLEPAQPQTCNNLGNALRGDGRLQEAVEAYRGAIALDPGFAIAHANLGIALQQAGRSAAAIECLRTAVEHDPGMAEASLNLGYLLEQQGETRGALDSYRKAIDARPEFAEAHFNHALQLLLAGEFEAGWEAYEWRLRHPDLERFWPFAGRPRWNGSPLDGRTILLYSEQGFGDALQFVRYAPLVAARGGKVVLQCQPKLRALFESVPGVSAVVAADEPPPAFELCCSLLSLPRIFGTRLESIPAQVPYLRADDEMTQRWSARLHADGARLRIGLFWATDSKTSISASRSLSLDLLAPLGQVAGAAFYSLQRGAAAGEAARPPAGMRIIDYTAELKDFSDDAALIANLDLVISINSATAHLAGAMGRPVWTLIHFPPDWRWLLGRSDSPWYPTMRLFRRGREEGWDRVVARVAEALAAR